MTNGLEKICPNTNICFAFDIETKSIKDYFDNFKNFSLVVIPIIKISSHSGNAFIQELRYKKNNYMAYTALKSSVTSRADNIYYEYLVGKKINTFRQFIPSFIETFDIYQYENKLAWEFSKDHNIVHESQLNFLFKNLKDITGIERTSLVTRSCERSKYLAIMIQLIKPATKLKNLFRDKHFTDYLLLPILFQVYASLFSLREVFTHYDLHYENIILYTPSPNTFIHYHYHVGDTIIQFKSPYMVKIIDYGRSHMSVGNIYEEVCKLCDNCGKSVGYQWLYPQKNEPRTYYITPRFLNNSADLRLLYDIRRKVASPNNFLKKMLTVKYNTPYGTPEDLTFKEGELHNIIDAFNMISKLMLLPEVLKMNETSVSKMTKFGDLEVYTDMSQPMRFTRAQN